ncbi:hypothetical protein NIES4103_28040 [Nostoc sp. NIES-4103]|nr:hypothetical protein NIES4103_28040 [Nostoc sp. NIES-4103]
MVLKASRSTQTGLDGIAAIAEGLTKMLIFEEPKCILVTDLGNKVEIDEAKLISAKPYSSKGIDARYFEVTVEPDTTYVVDMVAVSGHVREVILQAYDCL